MLRWLLLAVAVTVAMPVQAVADTPPIVRLRKSKAPAKAAPAAKKTAQASKAKRARKPVVAKRSTAKKQPAKKKRERAEVIRPMP